MSDTFVATRESLAKAVAELREAERMARSAKESAERRKKREERLATQIKERTIMVLRDTGPWRRYCATCSAEVVGICVRVDSGRGEQQGEIVRCENGHDCSARFTIRRSGGKNQWQRL